MTFVSAGSRTKVDPKIKRFAASLPSEKSNISGEVVPACKTEF